MQPPLHRFSSYFRLPDKSRDPSKGHPAAGGPLVTYTRGDFSDQRAAGPPAGFLGRKQMKLLFTILFVLFVIIVAAYDTGEGKQE